MKGLIGGSLVGAVQLGVGLLKERRPELVGLLGPQVDQPAVAGGEPVVDDDLHPLAEPAVITPGQTITQCPPGPQSSQVS